MSFFGIARSLARSFLSSPKLLFNLDSPPSSNVIPHSGPTQKQIEDYTPELVNAVRINDLERIRDFSEAGRLMSACNSYSESLLHLACRRSEMDVVYFVLQNGGDCNVVDDFGRTPLHDACWRSSQRFDIITLLLDLNKDLLRMTDIRGATPLSYVRPHHWLEWCAFIFHQKEK